MLRKRKSHTHTYTHTHYVNERIFVNIESGKNSSRKKIGTSNEENKNFVKLTSLCTSIHTVFFFFLNLILNYQSIVCSIYVVNTWSFLIRQSDICWNQNETVLVQQKNLIIRIDGKLDFLLWTLIGLDEKIAHNYCIDWYQIHTKCLWLWWWCNRKGWTVWITRHSAMN